MPPPGPLVSNDASAAPEPAASQDADEEETSSEQVTQELLHMAEEAEGDRSDAELAHEYTALFPQKLSITIADLFNFQDPYWSDACEKAAERGLDNELALYELLDDSLLADNGSQSHTELDAGVESAIFS